MSSNSTQAYNQYAPQLSTANTQNLETVTPPINTHENGNPNPTTRHPVLPHNVDQINSLQQK